MKAASRIHRILRPRRMPMMLVSRKPEYISAALLASYIGNPGYPAIESHEVTRLVDGPIGRYRRNRAGQLLGLDAFAVTFVATERVAQGLLKLRVVLLDGQIERLLRGIDSLVRSSSLVIGLRQLGQEPRILALA